MQRTALKRAFAPFSAAADRKRCHWLGGGMQNSNDRIVVPSSKTLAAGFFGLCALYGFIKLFDRAPGLVFDHEGIIDNSSGAVAGRVSWSEIRDIKAMTISGQRFLAFMVRDPERYLGKGNIVSRVFVKLNYKRYGTPIFIASHSLKTNFVDLEKQIRDFLGKHGNA
jgi:hypothetical protein